MTLATITTTERLDTTNRIHRNHPAREKFAGRSSGAGGNGYYETKGHAVNAFDAELQTYDLCFCCDDLADFNGSEGQVTLRVCNGGNCVVGYAHLSWYRMPSGRYEFIGYLA